MGITPEFLRFIADLVDVGNPDCQSESNNREDENTYGRGLAELSEAALNSIEIPPKNRGELDILIGDALITACKLRFPNCGQGRLAALGELMRDQRHQLAEIGGYAGSFPTKQTSQNPGQHGEEAAEQRQVEPIACGPVDPFEFHWGGRVVKFYGQPLRYQLLVALWDIEKGRPRKCRSREDVFSVVYGGEEPQGDYALDSLLKHTRRELQRAGLLLKIENSAGVFWLDPVET